MLSQGNLTSEGQVAAYVRIKEAGRYTVTIRAYGSELDGEWSKMAVCINGLPRERVSVETKSFKPFSFEVDLSAHVHSVGAYFLNDAWKIGTDRNLYLDSIAIKAPEGAPEPELATEKEWLADGRPREQVAVAASAERIEALRKGSAAVVLAGADGAPLADTEVTFELKRHAFLFGCNFTGYRSFPTEALNQAYEERFAEIFNFATLPFYWYLYEPEPGKPDYAKTDAMTAWCAERGIKTKGHPILWANKYGVPPWTKGEQPAVEVQKARVDDLMGRYKGTVQYWEVVNEPTNQPWADLLTPHQWARAADPSAKLVINEYGILYILHYKFHEQMQQAVADGVPFDAIGIQAHAPTTDAFPLDRVWAVLDEYAALGKELHITEFTPTSSGVKVTGAPWRDRWTQQEQADYAEKFYRVCFSHPAVTAISWWDFADNTGIFVAGGGLLQRDMTPKPAYEALRKLIKEEWHTRVTTRTDADGKATLAGYYGDYAVTATQGDKTLQASVTLVKDAAAPLGVALSAK